MTDKTPSPAPTYETLRALLQEVSAQTRHSDYDWPLCLQLEVDAALAAATPAPAPAVDASPVSDRKPLTHAQTRRCWENAPDHIRSATKSFADFERLMMFFEGVYGIAEQDGKQ